jgi:hypothetical protein
MEFLISPTLLFKIADTYKEAELSEGKLRVTGGNWEYTTVLAQQAEEEDNNEQEDENGDAEE